MQPCPAIFGLRGSRRGSSSNLVTITTTRKHNKSVAFDCTRMQRIIIRRMSSPLLFHNRQFIMATAGDYVNKPIECAIRSKVSSNWLHYHCPAPDPPVVSAHQFPSTVNHDDHKRFVAAQTPCCHARTRRWQWGDP